MTKIKKKHLIEEITSKINSGEVDNISAYGVACEIFEKYGLDSNSGAKIIKQDPNLSALILESAIKFKMLK